MVSGKKELSSVSVAVKLAGCSFPNTNLSTRRFLSTNQSNGDWIRQTLQDNSNNWLLDIVARVPAVTKYKQRKSSKAACRIICDNNDTQLLVVLGRGNAGAPYVDVPCIRVVACLAVESSGKFPDLEAYGASPGNLCEHMLSAIQTGNRNSDCCVVLSANILSTTVKGPVDVDTAMLRLVPTEDWSGAVATNIVPEVELFTPRQYLLLAKAFEGKLTKQDLTQDGYTYTARDIADAKRLLLSLEEEKDPLDHSNEPKDDGDHHNGGKAGGQSAKEKTVEQSGTKEKKARRCFYSPFCLMDTSVCGGFRKDLCREVNAGRVVIPKDEAEFLEAKRKHSRSNNQKAASPQKPQPEPKTPASATTKKSPATKHDNTKGGNGMKVSSRSANMVGDATAKPSNQGRGGKKTGDKTSTSTPEAKEKPDVEGTGSDSAETETERDNNRKRKGKRKSSEIDGDETEVESTPRRKSKSKKKKKHKRSRHSKDSGH